MDEWPISGSVAQPFLHPRSIAVVGASPYLDSVSGRPLKFLMQYDFQGDIYPVNPKYTKVAGLPCDPSVRAIPKPVDLAIIGVAAKHCPAIINDCAARKVKAAILSRVGLLKPGLLPTRPRPTRRPSSSGAVRAGIETGLRGHVVMENRHGLVVAARVTPATGTAERETALDLAAKVKRRAQGTVGADKAYDTREFVAALRTLELTPHVAQNTSGRASAIDGRTTRHPGYEISQVRKRIEEIFGWLKTVGLLRKTRHRGQAKVNWVFVFATAIYNLIRSCTLRDVLA